MAKHEINKSNMINDIVLTISLIISIILVELIMYIGSVNENQTFVFFILIFVLIKITYNGFSRIVRMYQYKKGIRG